MSLEEREAGPVHFIPAELRPPVGVEGALDAPPEPGASKEELRRQARAALAEFEREPVEMEEAVLGAADAVFAHSPEVSFTVLDGEAVILHLESGVYYTLNPVGTAVWELLNGECTISEMVAALCERYEIDAETARRDLAALLTRLRREGLISERR